MKVTLQPGLTSTKRVTVDRERTISFMGEEGRVYATPRLISDMEFTCRNFLLEHCDPGEDSVGAEIALKHLAATLEGSTVEITARITSVEGRKIVFDVAAKDEIETISAGTHTRVIVDLPRRIERLRAKAAKLETAKLAAAKAAAANS